MSVTFTGMEEFEAALRNLPKEMGAEAGDIVDQAIHTTATRVIQVYPKGDTGNLRAGVRTTFDQSAFGASGKVRSTSPHAHLWEWGTESRKTKKDWFRGKAKPHKTIGLVPIAQQERRRMNQKLLEVVRRAGFQVSGSF